MAIEGSCSFGICVVRRGHSRAGCRHPAIFYQHATHALCGMEHPSFGEWRFIPCQLVASAPVFVFGEEDRYFGRRRHQYPIGRGNGDYARGYFPVDSLSLFLGRAFNGSDSPPSTQRTFGGSWRTHVGKYVDIHSMCSIHRDFRLRFPGDGAVVFDAGGRIMSRIIKSELYKLKHTWVLWIHLVLPVFYALVFYLASKTTGLKIFPR